MTTAETTIKNDTEVAKDAKGSIFISEIYACTQGEGLLVGVPSVLVRTSLCNLRCKWGSDLCDTPFTSWNPDTSNKMTPQQIYDEVVKVATTDRKVPLNHVIISGGEPTLWNGDIANVIHALMVTGFHVTIETNGTKYIEIPTTTKDGRDLTSKILFSVSPKLKTSVPVGTPHEKSHNKARINTTVLDALLKRYPTYLKFVVTGETDLDEVLELQKELKVPSQCIFLMSEGVTREQIQEKSAATNELCIKHNFRYSPREHVNIYNSKRGV